MLFRSHMEVLERIHASGPAGAGELEAVLRGVTPAPAAVAFLRSRQNSPSTAISEYIGAGLDVRGLATVQINLLSPQEHAADEPAARLRLDARFLQARATAVLDWIAAHPSLAGRPLGLFADGHAAAAALLGAAARPDRVRAIVCLDGRLDLAGPCDVSLRTDTLLLVGEENTHVADLNRRARLHLSRARLELVPHATHRYDEPQALTHISWRTVEWFSHALLPGRERRQ